MADPRALPLLNSLPIKKPSKLVKQLTAKSSMEELLESIYLVVPPLVVSNHLVEPQEIKDSEVETLELEEMDNPPPCLLVTLVSKQHKKAWVTFSLLVVP